MASPARAAAFHILRRVERENAYASELLHSHRLANLSSADKGFCTELVMGVLRWRSRLDHRIAAVSSLALDRLDLEVLTALRMGSYQLLFLERVPARAAVNESVELVRHARKRSAVPFVNAVLRKLAAGQTLERAQIELGTAAEIAAHYAHPQWLVERWISAYGIAVARAICAADQQVPETAIRLSNAVVESELTEAGVQLAPGALLANARRVVAGDVTATRPYRAGDVFIQDEASQLVALLVGRGRRLLDCCAAPGGKTAMLAEHNTEAKIVALEIHPHRARLLRQRVSAPNVEVVNADVTTFAADEAYDRVLADVPCSGTGTLARNPEIKWRLRPEDLADLHQRQVAILRAALGRLEAGGRMVYSTCSLEPEECQDVVEQVLGEMMGFRLRPAREELDQLRQAGELVWSEVSALTRGSYLRTFPGVHQCDGFFAAIIERTQTSGRS
jgi:16S rRNA (cytosine967-C5)-methyltransferase